MVKAIELKLLFFFIIIVFLFHIASPRKKQERNESASAGKGYQINNASQGRTESSCTHHPHEYSPQDST